MEKYESRQQQIRRPAEQIYSVISDFNNFTPVVQGHVEDWTADETSCSFKVKGMTMRLRMVDKVPNDYVKVTGDERSPLDFTFWIQLKQVGDYDTRMRLVLHAKLNMVMKMMIGSKLQQGLDQMAEQMAKAFNGAGVSRRTREGLFHNKEWETDIRCPEPKKAAGEQRNCSPAAFFRTASVFYILSGTSMPSRRMPRRMTRATSQLRRSRKARTASFSSRRMEWS